MSRLVGTVLLVFALLAGPAVGQSAPLEAPGDDAAAWQAVIHSQVQAFRDQDPATAFSYSAAQFHTQFKTPEDFFLAIVNAGYAPMMESRSESFGPYEMITPDTVYQDVTFSGEDQKFYEAIYRLTRESAGWRVESVVLGEAPGTGA